MRYGIVAAVVAAASIGWFVATAPSGETSSGKQRAPAVFRVAETPQETFPWGWIRWVINAQRDPQAEMTFGLVHIKANQRNPVHLHKNCAEYLYVLKGSCEHLVGDAWVKLRAGDVVRIPAGVKHTARTGDEPMDAVIVYNAGQRDFTVLDQ